MARKIPAVGADAATSRNTVMVACKMPNGMVLQATQWVDVAEPVMGGGTRTIKQGRRFGPEITLNGNAAPYGVTPRHLIVGGYGMTRVDAEFWEAWIKDHALDSVIVNKIVFAYESQDDAVDQAEDQEEVRSGLEPIDPNRLPRGIEKADAQATA